MHITRWLLVGLSGAMLSACGGPEPSPEITETVAEPIEQGDPANTSLNEQIDAKVAGEMNIKAMLKDEDSAEFRNEFVSRLNGGNLMLCGEVNSKNGFGALTGYKRFIASPNPNAPSIIDGEQLDGKAFRQARNYACSNPVKTF